MKHKPMLLKKMTLSNRSASREVIGLIGTHRGVGVTHTSLMLAFYMGEELGRKTALLECNQHHDMSLLQEIYEWSCDDSRSFTFGRITCYKEVTQDSIADIMGEDYDCIIIDFGTDLQSSKQEFQRCGTKLIIGGRSEWDRIKLYRFVSASKTIHGSDTWRYLIPQVKEKIKIKIKNEVKRRVWSVPKNEEPTLPSYQTNRFFYELLRS